MLLKGILVQAFGILVPILNQGKTPPLLLGLLLIGLNAIGGQDKRKDRIAYAGDNDKILKITDIKKEFPTGTHVNH